MRNRSPAKIVMTSVIVVVVLLMMLTAQVNFELTDQGVLVRYRYAVILPEAQRLIAYDTIQGIELLSQLPPMRKVSGFESFGHMYLGRFRSDIIGVFQAYVKNPRLPLLLIRTSDKTYLISPSDAEVFASQINERVKR